MTGFIPMGQVISWRDRANTTNRYAFPSGKTTALSGDLIWQPTWSDPPPGQRYQLDNLGVSAAPLIVEPSWDYLIKADDGLSAAAAQANWEAKFNALVAVFAEDYTVSGKTYSGNVGYLRIYTSDKAHIYDGLARILKMPFQTKPGANVYALRVTLQFHMESDWVFVS